MPDVPSASPANPSGYAVTLIIAGAGLALFGRSVSGFLGGLLQGAAVALIVLGVVVLSRMRRAQRSGPDGEPADWLPSRDGAPRRDRP